MTVFATDDGLMIHNYFPSDPNTIDGAYVRCAQQLVAEAVRRDRIIVGDIEHVMAHEKKHDRWFVATMADTEPKGSPWNGIPHG